MITITCKLFLPAASVAFLLAACGARDLGDSPAADDGTAGLATGGGLEEDADAVLTGATADLSADDGAQGMPEDPLPESPFSPAECTPESIDACFGEAYEACSIAGVAEDICDDFIRCRTRTWGCFPNEWDEYEDWEQGVILPLSIVGYYTGCGGAQDICFLQARQFCTLRPELCAEAIAECRPMHESCAYTETPGPGTACPNAPIHCAAIQASVCDTDATTCAAVSAACDWLPTAC